MFLEEVARENSHTGTIKTPHIKVPAELRTGNFHAVRSQYKPPLCNLEINTFTGQPLINVTCSAVSHLAFLFSVKA